jgi:hypothetical protein
MEIRIFVLRNFNNGLMYFNTRFMNKCKMQLVKINKELKNLSNSKLKFNKIPKQIKYFKIIMMLIYIKFVNNFLKL